MRSVAFSFLLLLFLAPATEALSQTGQVTGTVTADATGEPIPGVNVIVEGTQLGTATDAEGAYTIPGVPPGTYTLRASFVGYGDETEQGVEVEAGEATSVDFVMQQQAAGLDEVVVIGYGEQQRQDLTGSVSSISTEALEAVQSLPISTVEHTLQGKVPGVRVVQNNGSPEGSFTVRIRGGNSIQGGSEPLYVVDGFPTDDADFVSPGDIESIEVLKDASATAIYGARGANGVVIITTKQGGEGGRVQYESRVGLQRITNTIDVVNAQQYAEMANEVAQNEGVEPPFPNPGDLQYNTDWQDETFRPALEQNHRLSFSGGQGQTRFFLSGSYMDREGIIRSSDYSRGTLRLNASSDLNSQLSVSNQITAVRASNNQVPNGRIGMLRNAFQAPPTVPVYDEDGNYYDYTDYFFVGVGFPRSPVIDANELTDHATSWQVQESFTAEYTPIENLTAKVLLGANYYEVSTDDYATRLHESGGSSGTAGAGRRRDVTYLNENTLNYNWSSNQDHRINATAGFTWQHSKTLGLSASGSGFVTDRLGNRALGSAETTSPSDIDESNWSLLSWLGRFNYSLKDRYLFTLTGRADGSSRFGSGNKWGYFPSAAFAWRLSEEPFLEDAGALSNLKVRLSWGRTGNQDIGLYNSLQRIGPTLLAMGSGLVAGFAPSNIGNPGLQWETTDQYNVGVDAGFWDQRLRLTADAYLKRTADLLANVNLPTSSGFGSVLRNLGSIQNVGVELGVGASPVLTESFEWTIDANISGNRNEVLELAQGNEFLGPSSSLHGTVHLIREGEPLSSFYGFVEQDQLSEDGQIQYVDQNDDGEINDEDRVIIGNPYPDFTFGFNTSLTYKNFDLSAFVQGVYGNEIYNNNLGFVAASFTRGMTQIVDVYENHWSPDNPDPNAEYPKLSTGTLFRPSGRFIEDGSYLRLESVRLGYRVPDLFGWQSQSGVNDFMVYVSGQNLLTLTGYSWYDPEVAEFGGSSLAKGVDRFTYPKARTYSIGLQVSF